MSTKRNSTISTKPPTPSIEDWIGGAAPETAPATKQDKNASRQVSKPANKHVNMQEPRQVVGAPDPEPTSMFSVRVPTSLVRKLRIRAVTDGRSIQDIVADLLRDYLDED